MENKGPMELLKTLTGERLNPTLAPYDDEAQFINELKILEYIDPLEFEQDNYGSNMQVRSLIRYLVALFPNYTLAETANKIHALLNNKNIEIEDLRIILDGRHINNPQKRTKEVSFTKLQMIGKELREMKQYNAIAKNVGVAYDTVRHIDIYLGIKKSAQMALTGRAVDALRDGLSVRKFAKKENLSLAIAYKHIVQAQKILTELNEPYIERKN
jgi:hypothetical protein